MSHSKLAVTAALLASMGATFVLGLTPAKALDLDDLDDLPPIRRLIPVPVPVPTGPVIVIPIDLDD